MNLHYLVDIKGHTDSVVIPIDVWHQILESLQKSPDSQQLLDTLPMPPIQEQKMDEFSSLYQAFEQAGLIGCLATDEQLASTYKQKLDFSHKHKIST